MKEILFRGQRVDNGEWVYGLPRFAKYFPEVEISAIEDENGNVYEDVNPETIYQFTGLLDKNGNKIFEGKNSLKLHIIGLGRGIVDVLMKDGQWQIYSESQGYTSLFEMLNNQAIKLEVIQNIHEDGNN